MVDDLFKSAALPDGDYAIVELLGHRTLVGRVAEIERFGVKMLQVEPIFQGRLLGPVLHGGASIYALTPCTREVAAKRGPMSHYGLPASIVATLSVEALPPPAESAFDDTWQGDDDE